MYATLQKESTLTYLSTKFIRIPELWNVIPNRDINSSSWIRVYRNRTAIILFVIVVIAAQSGAWRLHSGRTR